MAFEPESESSFLHVREASISDIYSALVLQPGYIRVLQLLPALSTEDQVECRVRRTSLTNTKSSRPISTGAARSIPYEALSYTWGQSTARFRIRLSALTFSKDSDSKKVQELKAYSPVTDNLYAALQRLRRRDVNRPLWVDALCINQGNLFERNQQVDSMDLIYSRATNVIIWLGEHDTEVEAPVQETAGRSVWVNECGKALISATKRTKPLWWDRVWTMQEAILARNLPKFCFGSYVVEWQTLLEDIEPCSRAILTSGGTQEDWEVFQDIVRLRYKASQIKEIRRRIQHGRPSLIRFFACLAGSHATDPRDMVYSVRGMIEDRERESIIPIYSESVVNCYAKATFALFLTQGHLGCMGLSQWRDLPSWAINFRFSGSQEQEVYLHSAHNVL